jgi:CheY-like chemotaxis protein
MEEVSIVRVQPALVPLVGEQPKTIMLVEDEPTVRNLLREVLTRCGYRVLACGSPDEGLDVCHRYEGPIDLLLTDVVMPGMNGCEMAERISAMLPGLRIIFMSGYSEQVLMQDGQLDPRIEYLQKPFTLQTLRTRLLQVLGDGERAMQ